MMAQKGEIVTCLSGHPIYRLEQDICVGTFVEAGQFESVNKHISDPLPHSEIETNCPECGAPFCRRSRRGVDFHFEDGWWTERGNDAET